MPPNLSITALAKLLGMDRTTLTRNLAPLQAEGLVALGAEGWRRSRTLAITARGRERLKAAMPLWESAQRRLRQELGAERWQQVQDGLGHLVELAADRQGRGAD